MNANSTKQQRKINDKKQKVEEQLIKKYKRIPNGSEVYSAYIKYNSGKNADKPIYYDIDMLPYNLSVMDELIEFNKRNISKKLTVEEAELFELVLSAENFENLHRIIKLYYYDSLMSKELCHTFTDSSHKYSAVVSNGSEGIEDGIYFVDSIEYAKVYEICSYELMNQTINGGFHIMVGNCEITDGKAIVDDVYRRQLKKATKLYLSCGDYLDKVASYRYGKSLSNMSFSATPFSNEV